MAEIHIERKHALGMEAARKVARQWMQQAEAEYGMECDYAEAGACDLANFQRAGIEGHVEVTADTFTLHATLGFLYGAFSDQIEERLHQNLDALLGTPAAADAGGAA